MPGEEKITGVSREQMNGDEGVSMRRVLAAVLSGVDRGWKSVHWECGLPTCENRRFLRSLPQSRVGIRLNNIWYCSMDCFVKAVRSRMAALTQTLAEVRAIDVPHRPRMPIGSLLLAKGYLSEDALRQALAQSRRNGEELETSLLRMELVDEWQLASARATQWGYPVLGRERVVQQIEAALPVTLMSQFSATPLHYSAGAKRLVVGFVYRVDQSLLHALEQVTGCRAEPCFITPAAFHHRSDLLRPAERIGPPRSDAAAEGYSETILEDPMNPAEMARMAGRFALEITARECYLCECRQYVWMRLSGKSRIKDVLFRSRISARVQDCNSHPARHREQLALG
ncbi:MAG: hypothetical protein ACP5E5_11170 [Acidobacteriaceae bacterium]